MNNTLQHWREAATLILAAGFQHGNLAPKMAAHISRSEKRRTTTFDYEVLLLKRSQKSGFMPNAFVFPGGVVDVSDFSNDWMKVFERHAKKPNFGLGVVRQPPGTRSPMFVTDRMRLGSMIPGEVAFRICAIRETFEESGILLVLPDGEDVTDQKLMAAAYEDDGEEMARWREEVQNNPLQFIQMCKELRCVPNIWALHEWGNWLTPIFSKNPRRFDTAFYIACLQKKPITTDDQKEVTSFNWWTPQEAIDEYRTQTTWIPPPQFYDLSRLCNFSSIDELHRFSCSRSLEGCERWMPVIVHAEDGVVHTLPGDDLYPEDPDVTGTSHKTYSCNKSIETLIHEGGRQHRLLQVNGVPTFFINLQPKYKHVNPLITDVSRREEPKSKM